MNWEAKWLVAKNNDAEAIDKLRSECIRLSEEYIQKKQEYDRIQEEQRKEQERLLQAAQAEKQNAEVASKLFILKSTLIN